MDPLDTIGPGESRAATAFNSPCSRSPQTVTALTGDVHISRDQASRIDQQLRREGMPLPSSRRFAAGPGNLARNAAGGVPDVREYHRGGSAGRIRGLRPRSPYWRKPARNTSRPSPSGSASSSRRLSPPLPSPLPMMNQETGVEHASCFRVPYGEERTAQSVR